MFGIALLGGAAFLVIRLFSSSVRSETRKIFEFYLAANEILRDDNRRWYGFEIREAIALGEKVIAAMHTAPPLLHFALGALYSRSGDNSSAVKHLNYVFEDGSVDESAIVFPTSELREYVRLLRRIEREPAESPLTSSAVRSLERMRTNRGAAMLAKCRETADIPTHVNLLESENHGFSRDSVVSDDHVQREEMGFAKFGRKQPTEHVDGEPRDETSGRIPQRKPITEVLHDIYDKKVH